jgi:aminoglycoside/choline kinase family phosphotransferase
MTRESAFLDRAGWSSAEVTHLPSDASDRCYSRIRRGDGASAILMSSPVATSAVSARQFIAFRRMAAWLRSVGLAAPEEFAVDTQAGLLLQEDLGTASLSKLLEQGAPDARDAYGAVLSVLTRLAEECVPNWLEQPDARAMAGMVDLTFSLLPGSNALAEELLGRLEEELEDTVGAPVVSLRDVHGDNLTWRPERDGLARVGLLDFQDALGLPDGYDLASLVDDPRRVVPCEWRDALIRDLAVARRSDHAEMARQVELLSVQRNLRILGIFRRLATEYGRPTYAHFLARTRFLISRSMSHPGLHRLRPAVGGLLERTSDWEVKAA